MTLFLRPLILRLDEILHQAEPHLSISLRIPSDCDPPDFFRFSHQKFIYIRASFVGPFLIPTFGKSVASYALCPLLVWVIQCVHFSPLITLFSQDRFIFFIPVLSLHLPAAGIPTPGRLSTSCSSCCHVQYRLPFQPYRLSKPMSTVQMVQLLLPRIEAAATSLLSKRPRGS